MKKDSIIKFFKEECSYRTQVYLKLSWQLRWFNHICVIAQVVLALVILCLAIEHSAAKQWMVFWLLLIVLLSNFFILLILSDRRRKKASEKYRKLHNDKSFFEIEYGKLKNELKSPRYKLFAHRRIQALKETIDLDIKNLNIGLIKLAAIAAIILGATFSGFVQTAYRPYGTPDYLSYNGAALLVLGGLGVFVCQIFLMLEDLTLILKNKYAHYTALKELSRVLGEILLDDELED